jgi:hypothetical protein
MAKTAVFSLLKTAKTAVFFPLVCPAGDPWDTFRRTLSGRFYVPHFISDAAADLIFKLLQASAALRAADSAVCWPPCDSQHLQPLAMQSSGFGMLL